MSDIPARWALAVTLGLITTAAVALPLYGRLALWPLLAIAALGYGTARLMWSWDRYGRRRA